MFAPSNDAFDALAALIPATGVLLVLLLLHSLCACIGALCGIVWLYTQYCGWAAVHPVPLLSSCASSTCYHAFPSMQASQLLPSLSERCSSTMQSMVGSLRWPPLTWGRAVSLLCLGRSSDWKIGQAPACVPVAWQHASFEARSRLFAAYGLAAAETACCIHCSHCAHHSLCRHAGTVLTAEELEDGQALATMAGETLLVSREHKATGDWH